MLIDEWIPRKKVWTQNWRTGAGLDVNRVERLRFRDEFSDIPEVTYCTESGLPRSPRFFGSGLQVRLQLKIRSECFGELAVGQSTIVSTDHATIPHLVSAPTMRVPDRIPDTINVYLAFRAVLIAIVKHNEATSSLIQSIKSPALGTGIGAMPVNRAARQMRAAYDSVFENPRWLREPNAILVHHEEMKSW